MTSKTTKTSKKQIGLVYQIFKKKNFSRGLNLIVLYISLVSSDDLPNFKFLDNDLRFFFFFFLT